MLRLFELLQNLKPIQPEDIIYIINDPRYRKLGNLLAPALTNKR
jgi:hypothetical protein